MPKPYRSFSGSLIDPEKQYLHDDEDTFSETSRSHGSSSRSSSGSHRPMLGGAYSNWSKGGFRTTFTHHFPQRRFTRWFTLIFSLFFVIFLLSLFKASRISQAHVASVVQNVTEPSPEWQQFPFLQRYYGGIRTLIDRAANDVEYPLSEDLEAQRLEDAAMQRKLNDEIKSQHQERETWQSRSLHFNPVTKSDREIIPMTPCYLDSSKNLSVPQLLAYQGLPRGFPNPVMGSHELLGLRDDICFDRHGRLGPYGYGYSKAFGGTGAGMYGDNDNKAAVWDGEIEIDWRTINWAVAQEECSALNSHRFSPFKIEKTEEHWSAMNDVKQKRSMEVDDSDHLTDRFLPRTAVIIRTWADYVYDEEDMLNLRALVNELSIQSGGEYAVHFLIHVRDDNLQIWADEEVYQSVLRDSLPEEFHGMGTLWSERQMGLIYGGIAETFYRQLPVHGVYRSTFMPLQYFAHMHPEYDFFWNWEMDVRYTGHFYHLFDRTSTWAKEQPRKGLWERSGRFYVPSKHGSYEDFRQMVRIQLEQGTASKENIFAKLSGDAKGTAMDGARHFEKPVWGPLPPEDEGENIDGSHDPVPPTSYDKDNYKWGVGEEADMITFNPLFDPEGTSWVLSQDVTGYNTTTSTPPRRASIGTASRLSRRLLEIMHRETALHRHSMFSEMWPATVSLHHGLKAVYVPHPVYVERAWPTSYLAAVFNNGKNGASGGSRSSVFSDERQHNFRSTTWYYDAEFGPKLWKRWLGFKVDEEGGEQFEVNGEGRMCLPAMLLHPVKHVDMLVEDLSVHPAGLD